MASPHLIEEPGPRVAGPVILAVMDGIGIGPGDAGDAVAQARTPTLDALAQEALCLPLRAHGTAVGLQTDADMGNSEVGHNALGAGRVFDQGAKRVAEAIASGRAFEGEAFTQLVHRAHLGGAVHVLGLLSDGNIHSHIDHALALLQRFDAADVARVFVHVLWDGRDVGRTSAHTYLAQLEAILAAINAKPKRAYHIASGGGRMQLTMDRYEADWAMVERGWAHHVLGQGRLFASAREALGVLRDEHPGIGDQDLPGFVVGHQGQPIGPVLPGDSMVAFNFRGDRMLEWVRVMQDEAFGAFARGPRPDVFFAGMTLYDGDTQRPRHYLVPPPVIEHTFGELLADAGVTQLACAETQKFGHVTYFWNGNRSGMFSPKLERYIEVPSVPAPFELRPAMSADAIARTVTATLAREKQRFCRLNLANGDMVGHTGNFVATVAAVEAVDSALAHLRAFVHAHQGALIVTADHGNAEEMLERDGATGLFRMNTAGQPIAKTAHTTRPVPCAIDLPASLRPHAHLSGLAGKRPGLTHIAGTCARLLGFQTAERHFDPSLITWKI